MHIEAIGIGPHEAGVTDTCELSDMGTDNKTWVLCKSTMHS